MSCDWNVIALGFIRLFIAHPGFLHVLNVGIQSWIALDKFKPGFPHRHSFSYSLYV